MAEILGLLKLMKKKEEFQSGSSNIPPQQPSPSPSSSSSNAGGIVLGIGIGFFILYIIIWLSLGTLAAYLSWKSNSVAGWSTLPKSIFSLFAFFFCLSYLISHLIHKLDLLNLLRYKYKVY